MIYRKTVGYPTPPNMPEGLTYLGEVSTHHQSGTVTEMYYRDGRNIKADEKEFLAIKAQTNSINKRDVPIWV
mgnify:CR=1 FL=1